MRHPTSNGHKFKKVQFVGAWPSKIKPEGFGALEKIGITYG